MKKRYITVVMLAFLIAVCGTQVITASARSVSDVGGASIIVCGSASVKAQADECRFYGSIEVAGNDLNGAESKSEEVYTIVKNAFATYGLVRENDYNIYPICGQSGYTATRYLSFTTKQTDKISEIRKALAGAGITGMNGINYTCTDDTTYKNRALSLAIENARAKAASLNAFAELIEVEELSCYPCYYDNGGTPEGTVTYTATVKAIFAETEKETEHQPVKYY